MIKQIGTAARLELEEFFGVKVYLDLHVRVDPEWRENDRMLGEMGIDRPDRDSARGARRDRKAGRRGPTDDL
jgi:hypothetical protein